jgi:adenylate kinase
MCDIPKISTGDMLREAVASGSDLGIKVSNILDSGALVSDDIIGSLIKERLTKPDCSKGSLFDGVPRTIGQAEQLAEMGIKFTHVIEIFVEDETIVDRMSGRRVHPSSGRNYHIDFNPPINDGVDNETGEPLIQREDDKPDTVLKRLGVYHEQTKPLTDFYSNLSSGSDLKFFQVDGSKTVNEVFKNISSQI